jgi:hypothetical protein
MTTVSNAIDTAGETVQTAYTEGVDWPWESAADASVGVAQAGSEAAQAAAEAAAKAAADAARAAPWAGLSLGAGGAASFVLTGSLVLLAGYAALKAKGRR